MAQEIIILFSFLLLLVVVYFMLLGLRSYNLNKREVLFYKISTISIALDSIKNLDKSPLHRQFVQLSTDINLIGLPEEYGSFLQTLTSKSKAQDFFDLISSNQNIKAFPQEFKAFSNMIEASLGDTTTLKLSSNLLIEKASIEENLNRISKRKLSIHHITEILQKIGYLGLIVIYPVRIAFLLMLWAIRTLREAKCIDKSQSGQDETF